MLALRLAQETTSSVDISWLIWVVLGIFVLMVLLGWWASSRLPKEDELVVTHDESHGDSHNHGEEAGQAAHGGHE